MTITKRHGESKADMCKLLFRKSWEVTEQNMEPDMDLVHEMLDRRIRVQDFLDLLLGKTELSESQMALLEWYNNR